MIKKMQIMNFNEEIILVEIVWHSWSSMIEIVKTPSSKEFIGAR